MCVIHKESLCPSSGDINRLMMMMLLGEDRDKGLLKKKSVSVRKRPGQEYPKPATMHEKFYGKCDLCLPLRETSDYMFRIGPFLP
jgi:hypothetical protein